VVGVTFNVIDLLAVLVVGMAVYFGWRSGFVIQAFALAGFLLGIGLVVLVAPFLAGLLTSTSTLLRTAIVITVVAAVVLIAQGIGSAVGGMLRQRLGSGVPGQPGAGADRANPQPVLFGGQGRADRHACRVGRNEVRFLAGHRGAERALGGLAAV